MKRIKIIFAFIAAAFAASSCYDDYVMDYEYCGAYFAYQYDLRTFVIGEGMKFDMGCGLGGLVENGKDRSVMLEPAPELITGSKLSAYGSEYNSISAFDVFYGYGAGPGDMSNDYVKKDFSASGIVQSQFKPLPEEYYSLSADPSSLRFKKGSFMASFTVTANEDKYLSDALVAAKPLAPYYALAYRIKKADVDTIISPKNFTVVAIRAENRFYGNWYHGGVTEVKNDASGERVSRKIYSTSIPTSNLYTLSTVTANSVSVPKLGDESKGITTLSFNEDDISVSSSVVDIQPVDGKKSCFNGAKLLQERKIFLNYKFSNGDGTTTYVCDTLTFRNRIRDGISEWQSEDPQDYK